MNMAAVERTKHSNPCVCGGEMTFKVATITRVIRGEEIRIHKVPHYECSSCGELVFDISTKIASIAVDAYKRGIRDVFYGTNE